jgi:hypothetical protein
MAFTLRLPLPTEERIVFLGGSPITLREYHPVVWIKLAPWNTPSLTAGIAFPVVVDSGNNHSFLIPETLFRAWTGLDLPTLKVHRRILANGALVGCYGFNLELLRMNADQPTQRVAAQLRVDHGIVVIPEDHEARFPRMPVLGVRTLCFNRVTFTLNGGRQTFTLTQPRPREA